MAPPCWLVLRRRQRGSRKLDAMDVAVTAIASACEIADTRCDVWESAGLDRAVSLDGSAPAALNDPDEKGRESQTEQNKRKFSAAAAASMPSVQVKS